MTNYHQKYPNNNFRAAWTVIELIFVIVIIGILAAIAIGKLSITRDDAKLSADVANMNICVREMSNIYTATNRNLVDINASSCQRVICYTIDINQTAMNVKPNPAADSYCLDVQNIGGHLAREYELSGPTIIR